MEYYKLPVMLRRQVWNAAVKTDSIDRRSAMVQDE